MRDNADNEAQKILALLRAKKSTFWERKREQNALKLFYMAAARVPAYKDFLRRNRINPQKIKTFKDFELVPPTSKETYLREYSLEKVCWDGNVKKPLVFTATSGSTGEPFYFPREQRLDWEYSVMIDMFLKNSSYRTNGPILVIIGFGMGVWIGGLITYKAFEIAAERFTRPVSIITPGINKPEIFHALRDLAPHYKEVILVGYPPFLKDVIDEAAGQKIELRKMNIRLLSAAEAYNEKFRDYLAYKAQLKNIYLDSLNIYGTADIGAMAWETPITILLRRIALKKQKVFSDLFSHIHKIPTLAQYNPLFVTFESLNENVLLTGNNTIPLVRYMVGDHGGVMNFNDAQKKVGEYGIDIYDASKRAGIKKHLTELPFVYVFERSDLSVKLYGAIIYPEHVREALQGKMVARLVTGKFTMLTKFDRRQNQFLEINIELKPHIKKPTQRLKHACKELIIRSLLVKNAEYRNNYSSIPHKVIPHVRFWQYEHQLYFKPGIKQKWVKKASIESKNRT